MPDTALRLRIFNAGRIREMTRLATQHEAINLAQGFPDFDPPAELVAAAHASLDQGFHQYAQSWGSPRMREALAKKQERFMGLPLDPDLHITVTCGATEAMMASIKAICNPGDKVIVFSPFYENYKAIIHLNGAQPLYVQLHRPDFTFDPQELRTAFQRGARALILCNPSNPSGHVFTPAELQIIADLAQEYDAWVVTDEVYEHIVYPPNRHTYVSSIPDMFEQTIACGSLSKTYSITGWRLGYIIADEQPTAQVRKVHDFLTNGAPAPFQEAAACALALPASYYTQLTTEYEQRRTIFTSYLDELGLPYSMPEGTYFCLVDISDCGFAGDVEFCNWLIEEIGVAAVPGSVFFDHQVTNFARFHFSKREATLHQAGERLLGVRQRV
ncbi:MAG TPA: aminotransferase class I/II-fold pyridoxal phosphate-dependent enzyme [Candidatus Angelobacter sp.]